MAKSNVTTLPVTQTITVQMAFQRDTKNTFVFGELDANGRMIDARADAEKCRIGTLYVRKSAFAGNEAPKAITVTISAK